VNHFSRLSALLSAAAIISVPGIACAVPLNSVAPVASENSNPACYIEQTDGSTLDLTRLCGSGGSSIPSSSASNSSSFSRSFSNTSGSSIFPDITNSYSPSSDSSGESASTQIEKARREANEKLYGDTRFSASNSDSAANCSTPDDIDAYGYRCGGRAASVRLGGQ